MSQFPPSVHASNANFAGQTYSPALVHESPSQSMQITREDRKLMTDLTDLQKHQNNPKAVNLYGKKIIEDVMGQENQAGQNAIAMTLMKRDQKFSAAERIQLYNTLKKNCTNPDGLGPVTVMIVNALVKVGRQGNVDQPPHEAPSGAVVSTVYSQQMPPQNAAPNGAPGIPQNPPS